MRHGFLLINKPEGPTSHDCVNEVRKQLGEKKVGHLGTLDPAASGLLVCAVGSKALKVVELFNDLTKEYRAKIRLGEVSTTYDREGVIEKVTLKPGVEIPSDVGLKNLIADRFVGKIDQVPPGHSAIKVSGERAYRKMRRLRQAQGKQGRRVDIPPRTVEISKCNVLSYEYPDLELEVACGSGTYIRSLAHDLGGLLHCGGYLAGLKRTKVGDWSLDQARELKKINWSDVMPLKEVMAGFEGVDLAQEEAEAIRHGRDINMKVAPDTIAWFEELPIAILIPLNGKAHARKVL